MPTQTNKANNTAKHATTSAIWGGRFNEATDAFVKAFTASIHFDQRLAPFDIQGSIAHATMLGKTGIITTDESRAIISGLQHISAQIQSGNFKWQIALEDVHMNIEAALTAQIGDVGKKLHTGRSRNDQVATDIRLYLRSETDAILTLIYRLIDGLLTLAADHTDTIMPGFTHLQTAQPVSFAHHILAWTEMLARDSERFTQTRTRINQLPLGSAALAGTTYPIDRQLVAKLLGFEGVCQNSLDAVSDRDFAIEFVSNASLVLVHLSRISEELILWSSQQFGFVAIADRFCTGSSIMPQKKNPDVPELVRGKTGRVFGSLMALLTLMKAQPLAYNKDNQEDKEPLFDSADTLKNCLTAFGDMLPTLAPNKDAMRAGARQGFATATDLADYLVKKGLAFRDAHEVVGKAVALGVARGVDLADLPLADLQQFSPLIGADVKDILTLEACLAARDHIGGTSPNQVQKAIARRRAWLAQQAQHYDTL